MNSANLPRRLNTLRLKGFDYSHEAAYFVTITTKNKCHYFGRIQEGEMHLSEIGRVVTTEWLKTPEIRPQLNLTMDEFVVMPDHFHGIIIFGNPNPYTYIFKGKCERKFVSPSNNLSSVIRGFKSAVTTYARKNGIEFNWHRNFWDVIIKDPQHLENTRNYRNNIAKWNKK